MKNSNIITIIIVVAAAALIVGGFIYFGQPGAPINSDLSVTPAPGSVDSQGLSRELLSALSSLKDLKLNTDFFKDKAFISLVDNSQNLPDGPLGRENPFLPVGAGPSLFSSSATSGTPVKK